MPRTWSRARLARLDGASVRRVGAGGRARPAPRDAGALRRLPQPGAPGRRRAQGRASSRNARRARRSRTSSKTFNTARVEALELDNLIETAKATIVSAESAPRIARRAGEERLPEPRRRRLAEALAVVSRRQPPRVQAGEHEAGVGGSLSAEDPHLLTRSARHEIPHLPLRPREGREALRPGLRRRARSARPDAARRADPGEGGRRHAVLPPKLPRRRLRLGRDEHQRQERISPASRT